MTVLRTDPRAAPPRPLVRRRLWWLAGSVLLHVAVLPFFLIQPRQEPTTKPEPSYEFVFQDSVPDRPDSQVPVPAQPPTVAEVTPEFPSDTTPDMGPERPTPLEPPVPDAMPNPPSDASAEPSPPEPPAPSLAPETPPTPLPMQPEPEAAAPKLAPSPPDPTSESDATRPPPAVRLAEPVPPTLTPQNLVPDLDVTVPPMPQPRSPAATRTAQRPRVPDQRFASPLDLNFGQAPSRAPPPRNSVAARAIDLSPGAPRPGLNKAEPYFDARARMAGADWGNSFDRFVSQKKYYPRQAAENGEDGVVVVELIISRAGRVESVEIRSRSGSPWLDMATLSMFRNAQLRPLPAEFTEPKLVMTFTMNYVTVRR